jgi:tRNA(Ile)-lysidine synthase
VQTLSQNVLEYSRKHELLRAGDRVGIAVSGGADSVALFRLLLELRKEIGVVLSLVHFNHKLRGAESDEDERFVAELAHKHKLEGHFESGDVSAHAAEKHLSLETAAREMRYLYFRRLLLESKVDRIATAHTLDDQAETVLLKIVRGAGSRGLAGIYPQLKTMDSRQIQKTNQTPHAGSIVRPLLGATRRDIEAYLQSLGQRWREDSSNRDLRHLRNRVRHGILPRLERELNPAVRGALAETAEIARAEEDYWQQEVMRILPSVWKTATGKRPNNQANTAMTLNLSSLLSLPLVLQRRVIRAVSEGLGLRLEFHHVEEILALSTNHAGATMVTKGWIVSRHQDQLRFEPPSSTMTSDYEYCLSVPGSVEVRETESRFEAVLVPANAVEGYNPEDLLDRALLATELEVRNWRAGDRFWPAHSKGPKRIKELLQERHATGLARSLWPIVTSGKDVIWLRGFTAPSQLRRNAGCEAVLIRETQNNER